ncbi:Lipase family protein [Candidatus Omnitrophus magneticus]|uniref:Lipase family protein n=1 Tax=Candidatus Omnitrophus magneticus TaxID=1609969 RepID=A0A0F0CR67_9BACT|nr:Lipase family protein [Candidatus Omnitrophus magneticus]
MDIVNNLPVRRAGYSDRIAYLMSCMSKLAYEKDEASLTKQLKDFGFDLPSENIIENKSESGKGTQAFVATKEKDKIAILAFRGTEKEKKDIITDFNIEFEILDKDQAVHKGFFTAFNDVKKDIIDILEKLTHDNYSIFITGHSLGGALAVIATHELDRYNLSACYTFGSPRVGNEQFGDAIKKTPIYRIVNKYDIVPCLPFRGIWWLKYLERMITKISNKDVNLEGNEYFHYGNIHYLDSALDSGEVKNNISEDEVMENIFKKIFEFLFENSSENLESLKLKFFELISFHDCQKYCDHLKSWAEKENPL